jgi:hypothetical protein
VVNFVNIDYVTLCNEQVFLAKDEIMVGAGICLFAATSRPAMEFTQLNIFGVSPGQ